MLKKVFLLLLMTAATGFSAHVEMVKNCDFSQGLKEWTPYTVKEWTRKSPFKADEKNGGVYVKFGGGKLPQPNLDVHSLCQKIRLVPGKVYALRVEADVRGWANFAVRYSKEVPSKEHDFAVNFNLHRKKKFYTQIFAYGGPDYPDGGQFRVDVGRNWDLDMNILKVSLQELDYSARKKLPFKDGWIVFPFANEPQDFSTLPAQLTNAAGKEVKPVKRYAQPYYKDRARTKLVQVQPKGFAPRTPAMLYQELDMPADEDVIVGMGADWWFDFYCNGKLIYSTFPGGNRTSEFSPDNNQFVLPLKKGKNLLAIRLHSGTWGWRIYYGIPRPLLPDVTFKEGKEYAHMPMKNIVIQKGTALDLSHLSEVPAGKYGRVVAGKHGGLEFEKRPGEPIRFQGTHNSLVWRFDWLNGSMEEFNKSVGPWAQAMRRQGYNAFRISAFDRWGSKGIKKAGEVPLEGWEKLDRLIYECKQNGIYVEFLCSFENLHAMRPPRQGTDVVPPALGMYLADPVLREQYRKHCTTLLNRVNPYTKMKLKDDPVLAVLECFNEQYYGFVLLQKDMDKKYPGVAKLFRKRWKDFLNARYASLPENKRPEPLRNGKLANPPLPFGIPDLRNDYRQFICDCVTETLQFYVKTARDAGYKGLIANNPTTAMAYCKAQYMGLPMIDTHSYYAHPSNLISKGSRCLSASSVAGAVTMFRGLNNQRPYGAPMWVGEYNHCFWNPYQHELPLEFGAYAALNNYGGLMIHSDAVELERPYNLIRCFEVSDSPVARAGEFVNSMLYRRGDVKASDKRVVLAIPNDHWSGVSSEQGKLAFITNFSITFPGLPRFAEMKNLPEPDLVLTPSGKASQVVMHRLYAAFTDAKDDSFSWKKTLDLLKAKKIITPDNISDPVNGVFQSDTKEITMRTRESLIKAVTPKTEAVTMLKKRSETLDTLKVLSSSEDALIALTSLDGLPLKNTAHMMLVYSTHMANKNMVLDGKRETLVKLGETRSLMKTGTLDIEFKTSADKIICYPLEINGTRRTPMEFVPRNGVVRIMIDTSVLKEGVTPFFELVAVKKKSNMSTNTIRLTGNGEENRRILQEALDRKGFIKVEGEGSFEVAGTLLISGDTTLEFAPGILLKRIDGKGLHFIANRAAYDASAKPDSNIEIRNLHFSTNGCDLTNVHAPGWRGHVMLLHVKNLQIFNFRCMDLAARGYGILISSFERVLIDGVHLEGEKDGVHFGPGKDFILRNGVFRTWDDPVALNAYDYYSSSPEFGWIENGLIENCVELPALPGTVMYGFFCRLLGGAWDNWKSGMSVQRSDMVISNGKTYCCGLAAGDVRKSLVAPSHEKGIAEAGGIPWKRVDNAVTRDAGCRNITFRNIRLEKDRPAAAGMIFDWNRFGRSVYPGSALPVFENITFDNIDIRSKIESFLILSVPCKDLKILNSNLNGAVITAKNAYGVQPETYGSGITEVTVSGKVQVQGDRSHTTKLIKK